MFVMAHADSLEWLSEYKAQPGLKSMPLDGHKDLDIGGIVLNL
jgi:hypothetical protein